ncbi:hypothetical protein GH714_018925 [Hevea brasiliensis]|uniref:RRM domain-containing protein n=1 Tax=Hevea brasiliensis TaxID=3981 RepID=A0A6A6K5M0_HEVBR|nr:hypothetical protein GH714_018925 [Hevea brasiliensis]
MEEDVVESKQIDSNYNSDDVGDKSEKSGIHVVNEENTVDVVGSNLSLDQKKMNVENKTLPAVPAEKRKLNDQDAVESAEPLKRQRRWKSESLKMPEHQSSNVAPATTPKDASQPTLSRRNFSRSDSSVSVEDAPRKRVVPPSQRPHTNSLRIDNFVRPFTLKAVQELLGKTGKVTSFWMDQIKTHCYVSYSSVEEAIETRNAVYNLQWPSNGGRLLAAEFVEPKEVKLKVEAPPAAPVTPGATAAPPLPEPSPRPQVSRQHLPPPPPLPSPPPLSNPPLAKERLLIHCHHFQRNMTLQLLLWMISLGKPEQLLGSIIFRCQKNKWQQNLLNGAKMPSNRDQSFSPHLPSWLLLGFSYGMFSNGKIVSHNRVFTGVAYRRSCSSQGTWFD